MINLIGWVIFGLVVGAIARFLVPGSNPIGCLGTVLLGIAGSVVGGVIGSILFDRGFITPAGWPGSIVGAIIVLLIWRRSQAKPQY